ncbi:hypothetical protein RRG08_047173 [Elysia crispata]|uniref:Uncharacterized protein n=1 Tax=Elysia crispata TaxID=231223 RepID=A0AAE0YMY6_9GAST|nr:hypothetical protein RRG08_047173 [Elysia crispata]
MSCLFERMAQYITRENSLGGFRAAQWKEFSTHKIGPSMLRQDVVHIKKSDTMPYQADSRKDIVNCRPAAVQTERQLLL